MRSTAVLEFPRCFVVYLPPPGTVAVGNNGQEPSFGAAFADML